jgi:hypothetical protein
MAIIMYERVTPLHISFLDGHFELEGRVPCIKHHILFNLLYI